MNSAKLLRFPTIHFLKFINFAFQETAFITFNLKFCKVAKNSKQQMCFSVYQFKKGRAPQLYQLKWMKETIKKLKIILSKKSKNTKEPNKKKNFDLISMWKYMLLIDKEYYKAAGIKEWYYLILQAKLLCCIFFTLAKAFIPLLSWKDITSCWF